MKHYTTFVAAALILAASLVTVPVAHAALMQHDKVITIPTQSILTENAYLVGGQITISTTAQKDVAVAAGKVLINGPVWGDVAAAGGTVDILDTVRGDVRAAGGSVTIQNVVGGDVVVAGGDVIIADGATVAGDLIVAGGTVTVNGSVSGKTKVYGGDVTVNSTLAGPVSIMAGKTVTFGEKAVMGSTLSYTAPTEAVTAAGAKLGDKVTFTKREMPSLDKGNVAKVLLALAATLFVIKLVGVGLTSVITVSMFEKFSLSVAREVRARFWHMVLLGFAAVVVGPPLILLLMISVVGFYVGLIVGALYMLAILFGAAYLCIITGAYLALWIKKDLRVNWKWTLIGTLVAFGVSLIPILGWVVVGIAYFASVGAMITNQYREFKAKM